MSFRTYSYVHFRMLHNVIHYASYFPFKDEFIMRLRLSKQERQALRKVTQQSRDVRVLRRALALLDLDAGYSADDVAQRYHVTRSTVYNWVKRYRTRGFSAKALDDRPRSGRPRQQRNNNQGNDDTHPEPSSEIG